MIEALIWGFAFLLMIAGCGGTAVLCVHKVESGKTKRLEEVERTKRQGMDNAWQLERERMERQPTLPPGTAGLLRDRAALEGISFDLAGGEDSWK